MAAQAVATAGVQNNPEAPKQFSNLQNRGKLFWTELKLQPYFNIYVIIFCLVLCLIA